MEKLTGYSKEYLDELRRIVREPETLTADDKRKIKVQSIRVADVLGPVAMVKVVLVYSIPSSSDESLVNPAMNVTECLVWSDIKFHVIDWCPKLILNDFVKIECTCHVYMKNKPPGWMDVDYSWYINEVKKNVTPLKKAR